MIGDVPMRKWEGQIFDREIIRAILEEVKIVHVGINTSDYPYVVPMNYGYEFTDDKLLIYLHGAKEGYKYRLWEEDPRVALTFDMFSNHPNDLFRGQMHDFRSVMANGIVRKLNRFEGQGHAVQCILRHNDRRPNQFSVPHFMFMDVYVVECEWEHVTAKSENPLKFVKDVHLPSLDEIRVSTEELFDFNEVFNEKRLPVKALPASEVVRFPPHGEFCRETTDSQKFRCSFLWESDDGNDYDVFAVILDRDDKLPRRFNIAFYNQLKDMDGCLLHHGDDVGSQPGFEEISVNLKKVPSFARKIVFYLSSHEGKTDVSNLKSCSVLVTVEETRQIISCGDISMKEKNGKCAAILVFYINSDGTATIDSDVTNNLDDWKMTSVMASHGLSKWKE